MQRHMNMQNVFQNGNFSGIFESTEQNFKSNFKHMAKIDIHEIGTIAPASEYENTLDCAIRPFFRCDHPFVFMIYDQKSSEILFAGIYHGP